MTNAIAERPSSGLVLKAVVCPGHPPERRPSRDLAKDADAVAEDLEYWLHELSDPEMAEVAEWIAAGMGNGMLLLRQAFWHARAGRRDEALEWCAKAKASERSWTITVGVGLAYLHVGEYGKALEHFRRAIETIPTCPRVSHWTVLAAWGSSPSRAAVREVIA